MTTSDVHRADDLVRLTLGTEPVTVPPPLGRLLLALAADRAAPRAPEHGTNLWRLPGRLPGRPCSPQHLRSRLAAMGLPARRGRNSALLDLAAQLLGITVTTADDWVTAAAGEHTNYAAGLSRRTPGT